MITLAPSPLGSEALDRPDCPPALADRMLREIGRVNALFGGRSAAAYGLARLLRGGPAPARLTLLDVGAGAGDIAADLARRARARGVDLVPITVDRLRAAAVLCRRRGLRAVVASAGALPFPDAAVDIVVASQFVHHFSRDTAVGLLRAFDRLARVGVIVAEPRRTPVAAAGIWAVALALGLHQTTRQDGVLTVRRSFTAGELRALLARAGIAGSVRRRLGFRLVATWETGHAHR